MGSTSDLYLLPTGEVYDIYGRKIDSAGHHGPVHGNGSYLKVETVYVHAPTDNATDWHAYLVTKDKQSIRVIYGCIGGWLIPESIHPEILALLPHAY